MPTQLQRADVVELVRSKVSDVLEIDISTVSESSTFAEDLDAESLAIIELVEALEKSLQESSPGFRVDDAELLKIKTVSDAVDYIVENSAS